MARPAAVIAELCGGGDVEEEEEEEIDPRIRVELESLNQAASDVNCLEKEINEARTKYQVTFSECSVELEALKNKHGSKIKKARPYYELREMSKEAQSEALRSARKFQSANSVYLAAKETISLAELRLMDEKAANLSTAWQEMLNHAVLRVMEAEQEKSKNEREHLEKAAVFADLEKKLHTLEKKFKTSIEKAKPYFDSKSELELKLQQIKQTIEDLQQAMQGAKTRYSDSLKRLESISDGIHEIRRKRLMLMYPREPGVGAEEGIDENVDELPSLHSSCLDVNSTAGEKDPLEDCDEDAVDDIDDEEYNETEDLNNEIDFRRKLLTCPLDSDESVFGKAKKSSRRSLMKSKSLPSHLGEELVCEDVSSEFHCTKDTKEDGDRTKAQFNVASQNKDIPEREALESIQPRVAELKSAEERVESINLRLEGEGEVCH